MSASADHIKALVKSHAAGDDEQFYSVTLQVAAGAAQRGHRKLALELKELVESARRSPRRASVTAIAKPRGELGELVTATFPEVRVRELVVSPAVHASIEQVIAEQRQRQRLIARGFHPAFRILLEGPPGTGKTMTASVVAHELDLPLLTIQLDSIFSKFLGETGSKLRTLFEAAAEQRAIYFFDEFDALAANRVGNDVGEARRILNSFLVFLEQASPQSIFIAATNHAAILDPAVFRRFDTTISYGLPDHTQARAVIKARLGPLGKGLRWPPVDAEVDGLSHAELVKAAESAAKAALMTGHAVVDTATLVEAVRARRGTEGA
jgi:SpoVK/Ycf46/Vps4 family AAA+-type ATPase